MFKHNNVVDEKEQIKVSIVVPVFKVENYLDRCIQSLLNQSYKNIEIILVDDGSPDECPKICDYYSRLDARVIVIHKKNGGLSSAIKEGIMNSSGNYIGFVDSDDWVHHDLIKDCVEKIKLYDAQIVMYDYYRETEMSHLKKRQSLNIKNGLYIGEMLLKLKKGMARFLYTRWNKIYKRNLVEFTLKFYDTSIAIGEDINFTAPIIDKAQSIYYLKKPEMTYFINNGAMTQTYNKRYFSDYRKLYRTLELYFGPNNQTLLFLDYRNMRGIIATIGRCKVMSKDVILKEVFNDKKTIENLEKIKSSSLSLKDRVLLHFMINRNVVFLEFIAQISSYRY